MQASHSNRTPRFGTDYLFNWLSQPSKNDKPEIAAERQLALAVLTCGEHKGHVQALGYSRDAWELSHNGRTATLTFQNFAQREGVYPRQFVAYTLQIADSRQRPLLHAVHERAYAENTDILLQRSRKLKLRRPSVLKRLQRIMQPVPPVAVPAPEKRTARPLAAALT